MQLHENRSLPTSQRMSLTRYLAVAAALAVITPLRAVPDLGIYSVVKIEAVKTSIYIGTVTMSLTPFLRHEAHFNATYSATVFPYFFYNEQGKISIDVSDQDLMRLSKGETITFSGKGVNDAGQPRLIEGRATATGPAVGKIKVRVYVTKKIALIFNTVYHLEEPRPAQAQSH